MAQQKLSTGKAKININALVSVELTECAIDLLWVLSREDIGAKYFVEKHNLHKPVEIQLWQLMNWFGSHCINGGKQVFKDNSIEIGLTNEMVQVVVEETVTDLERQKTHRCFPKKATDERPTLTLEHYVVCHYNLTVLGQTHWVTDLGHYGITQCEDELVTVYEETFQKIVRLFSSERKAIEDWLLKFDPNRYDWTDYCRGVPVEDTSIYAAGYKILEEGKP